MTFEEVFQQKLSASNPGCFSDKFAQDSSDEIARVLASNSSRPSRMTPNAQTAPMPNDAAMLAFRPSGSVFGLVANHTSQEKAGAAPAPQYGGNVIAVRYSSSPSATPKLKHAPIVRADIDLTELAACQDMLSSLFDHEGLAFFQADDVPYPLEPDIDDISSAEAIVGAMHVVESPAGVGQDADQVEAPTVSVAIAEGDEVSDVSVTPGEPQEKNGSEFAPTLDMGTANRKPAAFAMLALVVALGGIYVFTHGSNAVSGPPVAAVTKNTKPPVTAPAGANAPVRQAVLPITAAPAAPVQVVAAAPVHAPAPAPQMTSTALPRPTPLPPPLPLALPTVFEQEEPVAATARVKATPAASAAPAPKDKIVLLSADEAMAQKEDIPSPGKFVLLKTDSKPAPSKFKVLGDAKE